MIELNAVQIILFTVITCSVVIAALAMWLVIANGRRLQVVKDGFEQRLVQLEKQAKLAIHGAAGLGQRILALEEKLQQLQKQTEAVDASDGAVAYTQAMQLFEQGVDTDTVATSCGLSNAEANLMAMIHKQRNRAA